MRNYFVVLRMLAYLAVFAIVFCIGCESQPGAPAEPEMAAKVVDSAAVDVAVAAPEPIAEPVAEPEPPAEVEYTGVAVTVNGSDISEERVKEAMQPELDTLAERGKNMKPDFIKQYKDGIHSRVLERMILDELIDQQVKAKNIEVTEEDVMSMLEDMASKQRTPMSLEEFIVLIEKSGTSIDEAKKQLGEMLVRQKLIESEYGDEVEFTDDDALKYYSENTKQFEKPEEVKASHILIKPDKSDPNADPNQVMADAKAKADALLVQIQGGANFAELAKANSECPSATNGGDLGSFGKGRMVPAFEEAAFGLKVGQVSDVVETQFGYHIITVTDRTDGSVVTFEEAKDDIIRMLVQQEQRKNSGEYINNLKASASIVYPPGKEPQQPKRPSPFKPSTRPSPKKVE